MDEAFHFCEARVRELDKDRFLATLFAPQPRRGPLFALYAFDAEIAQVRDRVASPLPGEIRLQWWRDILTANEPGDAAASPIAAALLDTVRRFALPVPALLDLLDARTFDLYDEPMPTLAALESYAARTFANTIGLAGRVLGDGATRGQQDLVHHAGIACAIVALLQRLPLHSARGQRFLPDDLLAKHAATAADILAGRATPAVQAALAELRQLARQHLAALKRAGTGDDLSRLLPALLPVALVPAALARMERGADPFRPSIAPQWRRQWTLWRAARHPERLIGTGSDRAR